MGVLDRFRKKKEEEPRPSGPKAESVTPGGSSVYRYEEQEHGLRPPQSCGSCAEEIAAHFAALFPERESFVYHELVSDLVHIDVNILRPKEGADFYVLYTTGMSDLPMTLPEDIADREDLKYGELFLFLPGDWDLGREHQLGSDLPYEQFWPIQMLKYFARFPHEYHTWLGWGHSIPNGPRYEPICRGVGFGGVVLVQPQGVVPLDTEDGRHINFYMMVPAYKEEIEYKLKYGMEALGRRFVEGRLPMVLDTRRPNLCADFDEVLDQ